jgi:hypothetical protein
MTNIVTVRVIGCTILPRESLFQTRVTMRHSLLVICLLLPCISVAGQSENLPAILKPDQASEAEAQRMGAKVFKLLPWNMFPDRRQNFSDNDNSIGIRGGGAYFSFTTESHSLNRVPEIELDGKFMTSAASLAFFADLGSRDLTDIDSALIEAQFFVSYKPPMLLADIAHERKALNSLRIGKTSLEQNPKPTTGNSYLLRVMTWEKADLVVAFQILRSEPDGSITIAWKTIAVLQVPIVLYATDDDLQQNVNAVIAEEHLDCDVVVVKNNHLFFMVQPNNQAKIGDQKLESELRRRGIRYLGAGGSLSDQWWLVAPPTQ